MRNTLMALAILPFTLTACPQEIDCDDEENVEHPDCEVEDTDVVGDTDDGDGTDDTDVGDDTDEADA